MRAVGYVRVSTDEQADSGAGLDAQRDAIAACCARAGWAPDAEMRADEGVSGAAGLDRRPGLAEALGSLGKGDVLVVAKRDRLGRDPILCAFIEKEAARKGARVVSAAGEGTDSDDPASVLMRRIVDAFAEYERLLIKARTRAALGARRRRGRRTGTVPFGDELVDDGERTRADLPGRLVPNHHERAAIAWMVRARAQGLSLRAICRHLDAQGPPPRGGGKWRPSTVSDLIRRHQPAEATDHAPEAQRPPAA